MRLDKIYTKVGDKGATHLASGQKVSKASARIESYGQVDELNAHLGVWADLLRHELASASPPSALLERLASQVGVLQHELFDLGAELATPLASLRADRQRLLGAEVIARLEHEIDEFNTHLQPLVNFVLPGGHLLNSQAHVARCVCRRAERALVALSAAEAVRGECLVYLNRLSDWLFVAGRLASLALNKEEVLWQQGR